MKRDLELVRRIMLAAEAVPAGVHASGTELNINDAPPADLAAHLKLLIDEGYLEGKAYGTFDGLEPGNVLVLGIPWKGHEFLDAVRDDSVWRQIRERVAKMAGPVALSIITQLGTAIIKQQLGID